MSAGQDRFDYTASWERTPVQSATAPDAHQNPPWDPRLLSTTITTRSRLLLPPYKIDHGLLDQLAVTGRMTGLAMTDRDSSAVAEGLGLMLS